jgi:hypothetical protein
LTTIRLTRTIHLVRGLALAPRIFSQTSGKKVLQLLRLHLLLP